MSFTQYQQEVAEYDQKKGWIDKPELTVLHMQEELGEISRELLSHAGYKQREFQKDDLGGEICDLLYLVLKLANHYAIDLDAKWAETIKTYDKK